MHTFLCSAKELLDIAAELYGPHKWLNPDVMIPIHKIFEKVILPRIYNNEGLGMVVCGLDAENRWREVAKVIIMGKKNRIPQGDWLMALCAQVEDVYRKCK